MDNDSPCAVGNRRILIIDDTPSIHDDFRKILLATPTGSASDLASFEEALFGDAPKVAPAAADFQIDSAYQGQEALACVERAVTEGRPYAMAFLDMRMPPGWDGLQTLERLWAADPKLQVALCTAYTDYSLDQMSERVEMGDRLLILKKPFDAIEITQMARAMTAKWQMTEDAALKLNQLEAAVEERTRDLYDANTIVQNSPTILYRLRGEPPFSLIYVSRNIIKLGHSREQLLACGDWRQVLIHADDQARVAIAMAEAQVKATAGGAIEFRLRTGSGDYRWVENRYVPVRDAEGRLLEVEGIIIDVTERKQAEDRIARLARTDGLTGLANRSAFMDGLYQAATGTLNGGAPFAVFYLDLDHFKRINDSLGHAVGDLLLQEVARRLEKCTRSVDIVARLGGDEFCILQRDVRDRSAAKALAIKLHSELMQPYFLDGQDLFVSSSIGISTAPADSADADSYLTQADMALYRAKETGRNQFHFYSEDLDKAVSDRISLVSELKKALISDQLELYYLPEVDLKSGAILAMEALVRWNHPQRGLLLAGEFVPEAERTGTIVALGRWVLTQAPPRISVNLSLTQLKRGDELVKEVVQTLEHFDLSPSELEFDVTEATLSQIKWSRNDVVPQLREMGVVIAIDDFGTDYSSFDYLKTYKISRLKLAPSFINHASHDPDTAVILRTIVHFARDLGIGLIAEGVETPEHRQSLLATGSTMAAQGHYFSEAVDSQQAGQLLKEGHFSSAGA